MVHISSSRRADHARGDSIRSNRAALGHWGENKTRETTKRMAADNLSSVRRVRDAPLPPQAQTPPPEVGTEDLVLDAADLRALKIFHESFKLPGLRLGLLTPVCRDDYYPDDFEEVGAAPSAFLQHQANATQSLLQQAQVMLGEMDIAEEVVGESAAPHASRHRSAAPLRGSVKPRSAGARRPGGR
eukprot:scaffold27151_cov163-Isochrysis_galbana.AAC.2